MSGFGYNVLGFGANASGSSAPSEDQFNRVSFLSHFDGANNGVNDAFDDSSSNNHTISNTGSPTQGSFGPFARPDGEWAVDTSGGWMYWGYNSASTGALGDEDFCMECFVFINSFAAKQGIASRNYSGTGISNETWRWEVQTNGTMTMISKNFFGQDAAGLTSSTALTLNTWHHIAAVRQNDTLTFYIDGTARGATSSGSGVFSASDSMWNIGSNGYETSTSTSLQGTMSNFRLVVGSAVYTGNFTAPSSKLTAITNTEMLTYQSNRFVDNSADGNILDNSANPAVTAFGPFLTSAVYDAAVNGASSQLGATNYVHIADGAWKTLGTGDFTWEYWIYPIGENAYQVGDATAGTNISSTFTLGFSGKRIILYYSIQGGEAYPLQSPNSAPYYNNNEWHHLAYVRSGNDHKIYANGILRATETRSGTMVDSTGQFNIGNFGEGYAIGAPDGIYCDVRLVKGTAVYSGSTYTVPTAPLTAISNTELLVNFKDGQAIDSAAQNNLTLYGNANTSTDQAKFGTASLHLDGTGDYASFPYTPFGTGDFTVECFVRCLGTTYDKGIWDNHTSSASSDGITLTRISEQEFRLFGTGELIRSGNFTITNTWVHVATVRSSTTLNLFVNGVSQGTTYFTANLNSSADFVIGGGRYAGGPETGSINAYIDDFRISDFARYTSNFTAPTKPFADKGQ